MYAAGYTTMKSAYPKPVSLPALRGSRFPKILFARSAA